jgi:hypothetical protein
LESQWWGMKKAAAAAAAASWEWHQRHTLPTYIHIHTCLTCFSDTTHHTLPTYNIYIHVWHAFLTPLTIHYLHTYIHIHTCLTCFSDTTHHTYITCNPKLLSL